MLMRRIITLICLNIKKPKAEERNNSTSSYKHPKDRCQDGIATSPILIPYGIFSKTKMMIWEDHPLEVLLD